MTKLRLLIRFFFRGFFSGESRTAVRIARHTGRGSDHHVDSEILAARAVWPEAIGFDAAMQSLTDKYLYIAICMTVAGLVAALRAGTLFPDRQDFANLAPLPVDLRQLLTAKAVALTGFLFAVIASMNVFSSLFFPAIALSHGTLDRVSAILAGPCARTQRGCSLHVLHRARGAGHTHVRSAVRLVLACQAIRAVRLGGGVARAALHHRAGDEGSGPGTHRRIDMGGWLPAMWFVGLYQTIQGVPMGALSDLWPTLSRPQPAPCCCRHCLCAELSLVLPQVGGIGRQRAADHSCPRRTVPLPRPHCISHRLRPCMLPFHRAHSCAKRSAIGCVRGHHGTRCVACGGRCLIRSVVRHSHCIADPVYSLLTSLRFAFGIPVDPESMWVFRVASHPDAEPLKLVKRTLLCFAAIVIVPSAGVLAFTNGPIMAALHFVFAWLATFGLVDILTVGFRAVPFTCAWMPHRNNAVMPLATWIAGLAFFGPGLAGFEKVFLIYPHRVIWVIAFLAAIGWACRRTEEGKEVVAWSDTRGEFEMLRITD